MEQPKVFEFAKEIGMETLSLMAKLREWNVAVRSHMAELDDATITLIREKLDAEAGPKKKAVKKKAATTTTAPAATTRKTAAKKEAAAPKKAAVEAAPKAKKVIRRKAGEPAPAGTATTTAPVAPEPEVLEAPEIPVTVQEGIEEQASVEAAAPQTSDEAPATLLDVPAAQSPAAPVAAPARPTVVTPAPRRPTNIVGKMDLSRARVQPRTPMTSRPAPPMARNIRTGFIPMLPVEEPDHEESKRREEKKRRAARAATEAGTAKEQEVEEFSATEFRKREMVFQPKKKKTTLGRASLKTAITTPKAQKRIVEIHGTIKVSDFAREMSVKVGQVVGHLVKNGVMVTPNDTIDFDTATLVAPEFGYETKNVLKTAKEIVETVGFGELTAEPTPRAPVVTVMGHVDHGKTSLLDAIRKSDVAAGEAGGITQHIGAYKVTLEEGRVVTFIDTPGHEAFTAMRARGANATDVVVLVVAADDGVMHQTIEAINHAKSAGVPIIVAINKVDKPNANVERIKQQLTEYELVAEAWGGTTIFCEVSATKKTGIKELLEQLTVQAEILELKANPKRSGVGLVLESRVEKGRGVVATILVKDGTVKVGQWICAGGASGRVRALINDRGENVVEAGPSDPVELLGLSEAPRAGDAFDICRDEAAAESLAEKRREEINTRYGC